MLTTDTLAPPLDGLLPFPPWLQRRLRQLTVQFATPPDDILRKMARRDYARIGGGDGSQLTQDHLLLLGRAWMVGGPHLPAPPLYMLPCVIQVLGSLSKEDPHLEGAMLLWSTDYLRQFGWKKSGIFSQVNEGQRTHALRRYWAWLQRVLVAHCPAALAPDTTDLLASRVIRHLFREVGLRGFLRRMRTWREVRYPPEALQRLAGTVPDASLRFDHFSTGLPWQPDVRIHHLATPADLRREGTTMKNCVGNLGPHLRGRTALFFAVHGPGRHRATLALQVDEFGHWSRLDLRARRNRRIPDGRPQALAADALCQALTALGATDPLLVEYLRVQTRTADLAVARRTDHGRGQSAPVHPGAWRGCALRRHSTGVEGGAEVTRSD